jgi:hypothetical protein
VLFLRFGRPRDRSEQARPRLLARFRTA